MSDQIPAIVWPWRSSTFYSSLCKLMLVLRTQLTGAKDNSQDHDRLQTGDKHVTTGRINQVETVHMEF